MPESRDEALLAIARQTLGLVTLEARGSNGLDFHDLSIWAVRAALEAAYEAGRAAAAEEKL